MPGFDRARLRDCACELTAEFRLPGLSVGVVDGGSLAFAESWGLADIEGGVPMTPEHRQRIASITKTMVALCAMALVDEGRLSLGDLVAERLPDIPFKGPFETLNIWHLLTHTGGIGETPDVSHLRDPFSLLFGKPEGSIAEAYAGGFTIEVEPGSRWAYANHGFFLLGEIIARAEGEPLCEVARRRIFEPLGMTDTDMLDHAHPGLSTPYHRAPGDDERELLLRAGREVPDEPTVDGINIRGEYMPEWGRGAAGGVQSTIPDMAKYATALLAGGAGIVRPETFQQMVARQYSPHPALQAWGLGFGVSEHYGRRTFGHGGNALGGWNSNLTVFPEEGMALLVHTNVTFAGFHHVVARLRQAVLGAPGFEATVTLPFELVAGLPGVYEAPTPGPLTNFRIMTTFGRLQVSAWEGKLVLHSRRGDWKAGVRLEVLSEEYPDVLVVDEGVPDPSRIAVIRDEDGAINRLVYGDGQIWHLQRTERVQPWA